MSETIIHPSAIIEDGAELDEGCKIGPFCLVSSKAKIAKGVELMSHVVIQGDTTVGEDTLVHPFAVLGGIPQDLKYKGEESRLIVGKRNRIRESVTMNSGTAQGGGLTQVGDDGLYMTGAHVAHDCRVGNNVVIVNCVGIAGHVVIEDDVIVGGLSVIHQWVRLGRGCIIGAVTMVTADVIPYGLVQAPRGQLDGLNLVGLKRRGVPRSDITALRAAFQMLAQGEGAFQDRARRLGDETESDYVRDIVNFISGESDRSFLTPG